MSDDVLDPVLGRLTLAPRFGWYESEPRPVRFLREQQCRFVIEDYDTNEVHRGEIRRAVQNALNAGAEILSDAERYVVQYCQEMLVRYPKEHRPDVRVEKATDVWAYVTFGGDIHVNRRAEGDSEDGHVAADGRRFERRTPSVTPTRRRLVTLARSLRSRRHGTLA